MKNFSHGGNEDTNANSRIKRSLSRKGSQRGGDVRKISNPNTAADDRETIVATSSPRGPSTPEKATVVEVGTSDYSSNSQTRQYHHLITVTTDSINVATEGRCSLWRNSFKRPLPSWVLDPKRVLFLFAILSCMGTILLIYLTLSVGKLSPSDDALD